MDKAYSLSSPMVVQLLDMKNDSFCHCENGENLFDHEVSYLSDISALMYLDNCIV